MVITTIVFGEGGMELMGKWRDGCEREKRVEDW